jgi:hypothetical protein
VLPFGDCPGSHLPSASVPAADPVAVAATPERLAASATGDEAAGLGVVVAPVDAELDAAPEDPVVREP